ncbi:hypothetical protein STTU_3317 [Streptomyces sp. Tu6071]|nr:hypothetical protein STTU_3317 [Streptomyces sp. Tu6071]
MRLIAAPADPLTREVAAAATPVGALLAWCAPCHSAATRAARRAAAPVADVPGLFEL